MGTADPVQYAVDRITAAMGWLDDPGTEDLAEGLREVLDQLTGFCSPHMRLVGKSQTESKILMEQRDYYRRRWIFHGLSIPYLYIQYRAEDEEELNDNK